VSLSSKQMCSCAAGGIRTTDIEVRHRDFCCGAPQADIWWGIRSLRDLRLGKVDALAWLSYYGKY